MGVYVPGIKGGIEGADARLVAQARFDLRHQPKEGRGVALIKRLGQFRQHALAKDRYLADDNARAIAPVVFANRERGSRYGIALGCALVAAAFATQATIGIARGLLGLVEAIAHIGFGIIFL